MVDGLVDGRKATTGGEGVIVRVERLVIEGKAKKGLWRGIRTDSEGGEGREKTP